MFASPEIVAQIRTETDRLIEDVRKHATTAERLQIVGIVRELEAAGPFDVLELVDRILNGGK